MVELGGREEQDMWDRIDELAAQLTRTVVELKDEIAKARQEDPDERPDDVQWRRG